MKTKLLHSLKAQLFLLILLAMLPPLGIYVFSAWDSRQRAAEDAYKEGRMLLQSLAGEYETALTASRQLLMTLSHLPEVKGRRGAAVRRILQDLRGHSALYGNLFLLDEEGRTVASTDEINPELRFDKRRYFQEAKRRGDFSAGEYVIGASLKRPVFHLAYPVRDQKGAFRGVVAVSLDVGRFGQSLSLAGLPAGSIFCLLDHSGTILYHHPVEEGQIGRAEAPEVFRQMAQGSAEGHYLAKDQQGREMFYIYRRFSLTREGPAYLYMRIGLPKKEVLKGAQRSLLLSGVLLGSAVLLTLLSAWFFARTVIVRRLARLAEVAQALGRGDLSARANLADEKDELGELVRSFDAMAENLQKAQEERSLAAAKEREARLKAEELAGQLAVVAEIGRIIGSNLRIEEVYGPFAEAAERLIPFDRMTLNLHYPEQDLVVVAYSAGMEIAGRGAGEGFPFANSLSQAVAAKSEGLLLLPETGEDLERLFPGHMKAAAQAGIRSLIGVPLPYRRRVIGSLHFWSRKPRAYGEGDLEIARWIAGQIAGAIGAAQLFLELQEKEMALRESEGKFRSLFEQAAVGVSELDLRTGRFLTVNNRLCEILGLTKEELLATTFQSITHPEDAAKHEEKAALLLAGRIDHFSLEKRYLRRDGKVVWVSIFLSPLWGEEEEPGRVMSVVMDITDRKAMEDKIREMSLRDELTGLYNRRGFLALAEQQLKTARRSGRPMLLIFMDCDGLKEVNDSFGHQAGDRLLADTAELLRRTFREADIIARLGGDEFAVLSLDVPANAEDILGRLREGIAAFNARMERPYALSLSWGTALFDPSGPVRVEELLGLADQRMYEQKQGKVAGRPREDASREGDRG